MLLCYSTKVFNQYNEVTCFLHLSTQLTDGFRKKKKKSIQEQRIVLEELKSPPSKLYLYLGLVRSIR